MSLNTSVSCEFVSQQTNIPTCWFVNSKNRKYNFKLF